ncbi:MAG: prolipoprotein diacylglyceryl transferase [Candidatus Daviesbacteria bacterium]|nr:prolipoprotein diacylglyceryl transferase [Candidatus Daviesbacteria bacterium]
MFPVLFSIGRYPLSSFGVFLAMGFLLGIFLVWRLGRAWELDEEKTLDITLLTFLGGLLGARIYFAIEHLQDFSSPLDLILINKAPGLSFWGGILGGWLTLYFLARRKRLNFWQLADIAVVGLLGGLIMSDIGCFLGGCDVGSSSKAFFAVTMIGSIGKRWPIQIMEALFLTVSLVNVWSQATHFHQRGKIVSLALVYIGISKLVLEPFRQDHSGVIFSVVFILLGATIFYRLNKQTPIEHLKILGQFLIKFFTDPDTRKDVVQTLSKTWYNQKTAIGWRLRNLKKILRRSNVKFS